MTETKKLALVARVTDKVGSEGKDVKFTFSTKLTQNNGHYAVQGHSRSPILVPIESSYATSY